MATEKPTSLEDCMRELQELLPGFSDLNEEVLASEKVIAEKRGVYDHYRQDYETAVIKHNGVAQRLVEMRSLIQDNQMRAINAFLKMMAENDDEC